jgi:hypothetical protein
MKSVEIKNLMSECTRQASRLESFQYKNGSYSRYGGDSAVSAFLELRQKLEIYYEEAREREITEKVLSNVCVKVAMSV